MSDTMFEKLESAVNSLSKCLEIKCLGSSERIRVVMSNPVLINALCRDDEHWMYSSELDAFVASYYDGVQVGFITVYRQAAEDSSKDLLTHVLDKLHGGGRHGDK